MHASTVGTPTAGYCGTVFIAIELSQKTWLVTLHSPERGRVSRHKLEGGDHAGLLAMIEKVRGRAAEKLGSAPRVVSCYEAGYDGFWLHRLLAAGGSLILSSMRRALRSSSGHSGRKPTGSTGSFCCAP